MAEEKPKVSRKQKLIDTFSVKIAKRFGETQDNLFLFPFMVKGEKSSPETLTKKLTETSKKISINTVYVPPYNPDSVVDSATASYMRDSTDIYPLQIVLPGLYYRSLKEDSFALITYFCFERAPHIVEKGYALYLKRLYKKQHPDSGSKSGRERATIALPVVLMGGYNIIVSPGEITADNIERYLAEVDSNPLIGRIITRDEYVKDREEKLAEWEAKLKSTDESSKNSKAYIKEMNRFQHEKERKLFNPMDHFKGYIYVHASGAKMMYKVFGPDENHRKQRNSTSIESFLQEEMVDLGEFKIGDGVPHMDFDAGRQIHYNDAVKQILENKLLAMK